MSTLHRERWFPVWLVLPGSLTLMLLWLLPMAVLVQLTLGVSSGALARVWHMLEVLVQDQVVQQGLIEQTLHMAGMVVLEAALGLLLARSLPLKGYAAGWWCTLLGVMLSTPLVISVMGWKLPFQPELAMTDWCLPGLPCMPGALAALPRQWIVLLRDLWQWVPLFALLCLARLRRIERIRYQAVQFDGGGRWAAFLLLEWPWLRGALALGVFYRLMLGAIVDVDFFRYLIHNSDGVLARLARSQDWFSGVSASVPGSAPMSWLLPGLLTSTDRLSDVPIHDLTACLTLLQALMTLPLMLMVFLLVGGGHPSSLMLKALAADEEGPELGRQRNCLTGGCRWLLLGIFALYGLFPLFWIARLALQGAGGGSQIGLTHFMAVLDDPVWRASLVRTSVRALLTAGVAVALAVPMAYSWSRRILAGDRFQAVLLLASLMMPTVVLAFPMNHLSELLGWLGMPYAVGLAHLSVVVPLAVWILAAGMSQVPVALDEMALHDGFGFTRFMFRVLLPSIRQQVLGAFLVCFLVGWMEFLFARVLGSVVWPPSVVMLSESVAALPPVQAGVSRLEWQVLAAASWLVLLPVVLAIYALRWQLPDMLSLFRLPSLSGRVRRV
ncbi:MAG: hypothetical protein Q4B13_04755 [Lautropia sp.]|nr:hypothetical protein [Lautropia sp.]